MKHAMFLAIVAGGALLSPARAEFPRGKPAPAFTLRRVDGPPLALAALRGKVVFLDFWGPS
jgi:cytochrome c biogenesis protein CcmG, thiol:disulfide interchange protein DsbE